VHVVHMSMIMKIILQALIKVPHIQIISLHTPNAEMNEIVLIQQNRSHKAK